MNFVDYDENVCPYCGGKLIHPVVGHINKDAETWKLWEESLKLCHKVEVVDEGGGTIGYHAYCRNVNYD